MLGHVAFVNSKRLDKSRIVEDGNFHKFTKSKEDLGLKRKLLETGERELVEVRTWWFVRETMLTQSQASPTDRIWGVGFGAADAEENRKDWGENLLGKAITAARDRIREQS